METIAAKPPPTVLNNSAIACWHAGQIQEAIELFQIALSQLRCSLEVHNTNQQSHSFISKSVVPKDVQAACTVPVCSIDAANSVHYATAQDTSILTCFVQAFQVDCSIPWTNDLVLSSVVLFNVALLSHLKGMACGKAQYMDQAYKMYRLAFGLLLPEKGNALLQLALLNNMAHIDAHYFRREEMKVSLICMQSIISADENGEEEVFIDEDTYSIFCLNVVHGEESVLLGAPAA